MLIYIRLAEMTLVMMSLPLACVFQCLFTFSLVFRFVLIGGNFTAQSTGSHRGIVGGIQIPEKWQGLPPFPTLPPDMAAGREKAGYPDIHWIEIYPVDSIIHLLNNWALIG